MTLLFVPDEHQQISGRQPCNDRTGQQRSPTAKKRFKENEGVIVVGNRQGSSGTTEHDTLSPLEQRQ